MTHHTVVPEADRTDPHDPTSESGALRPVPPPVVGTEAIGPRSASGPAEQVCALPDGRHASAGRRRRGLPRTVLAWHERGRRARAGAADAGMATAEYAIATLAAVGFAGLLVVILKGNEVKGLLLGIIRQALSL
jgi:hypothetical protein